MVRNIVYFEKSGVKFGRLLNSIQDRKATFRSSCRDNRKFEDSRNRYSTIVVVLISLSCRNLFYNKERTDAEQLARLVEYVRKNVQHLDNISSEQILCDGNITWLPFREEETMESDGGEDS